MSDIFISYASTDKNRAELIAKTFSEQGWTVWWDRQIPPGQTYDEVIEKALNSTRCVIVLWTKDSILSRWVKTEAAEAAVKGILVPVLFDKVQIPLEFKRIEAADLTDWHGASPHSEFDHLLNTIAGILSDNLHPQPQIKLQQTKNQMQSRGWWRTLFRILKISTGILIFCGITFTLYKSGLFRHSTIENNLKSTESTSTESIGDEASSKLGQSVTSKNQADLSNEAAGTSEHTTESKAEQNKQINLLAPENGGQLLVASSDEWTSTIDGKEDWSEIKGEIEKEAVYGFRNDQLVTFDTFTMLILEASNNNVMDFELLAGIDSPTGIFKSIGKFQTHNVKLFKTPYQEFKFPAQTAKYLKVKITKNHGVYSATYVREFQLLGSYF